MPALSQSLDSTKVNPLPVPIKAEQQTNAPLGSTTAQSEPGETSSATGAPDKDIFSLQRDLTGLFANSVNLFSGEATFAVPLVSVSGRGGLGMNVSLSYNSANVTRQTKTWNLEAPTSTVGLGWTLDIPKIIVDHKQTGTFDDDDFFLIEGGVSNQLIPISDANSVYTFQAKNYQVWKIEYNIATETWTITKENGMTYIYGNPSSNRNTVHYAVRWGNWFGNSAVSSGQSQQAIQWDLSAIKNTGGDQTTFTYEQAQQSVGASGNNHTEASYLTKVTNPQGQSVNLIYDNKTPEEYQDPHTEKTPEPDAYQERYERRFLDKIEVRTKSNALSYTVGLSYSFLGSGDFKKRLLSDIQRTGTSNEELPKISFRYHPSGNRKGAVSQVTTPQGSDIFYTYHAGLALGQSARNLTIPAPSGYAEPQTWIGSDYVVVAWRQRLNGQYSAEGRTVKLSVFQWLGYWKEQELVGAGSVELAGNRYKDFSVALGEDFFAVMHKIGTSGSVLIHRKDDGIPGYWTTESKSFASSAGTVTLMIGNKFVAVGSRNSGDLKAWQWRGASWQEEEFFQNGGDFAYTSSGNYFIVHNNVPNPDQIKFYYLDRYNTWQNKSMPSFTSVNNSGSRQSYWYGANSFALVMADDNSKFIYQWDENYNFTKLDVLGGWDDQSKVRISNNSLMIAHQGSGKVARYNGNEWKQSTFSYLNDVYFDQTSIGEDLLIYNKGTQNSGAYQAGLKLFNANTNAWGGEAVITSLDNNLYKSTIAALGYFYADGEFFYRQPDGTRTIFRRETPNPGQSTYKTDGVHMFALTTNSNRVKVLDIRNGTVISEDIFEVDGKIYHYKFYTDSDGQTNPTAYTKTSQLLANNTLITYSSSDPNMTNATSLNLYRLAGGNIQGKQNAYPITQIRVEYDGQVDFTSYAYTASSATATADGFSAQFNHVKVVPGYFNPSPSPYGYSDNYFFTSLPSNLSTEGYPTSNRSNYQHLIGMPYKTNIRDRNGNQVGESTTQWSIFSKNIARGNKIIGRSYYARTVAQTQSQGGLSTVTNYVYGNDTHLQPTSITTTDSEGRQRNVTYQYAADFSGTEYGSNLLRERNMHSQALVLTTKIGTTTIGKSTSTYQLYNGHVLPSQTNTHPNGGTEVIQTNYLYDNYGNLVQSQTQNDLAIAYLWGYDYSLPVAKVIGTTYSSVLTKVSLSTIQTLDGQPLRNELNKVRTGLPGQLVTTYTYDPLKGKTSSTDPAGITSFMEYDGLGRLVVTKDFEQKILSRYQYRYANQ